jgi:hypothetical protein
MPSGSLLKMHKWVRLSFDHDITVANLRAFLALCDQEEIKPDARVFWEHQTGSSIYALEVRYQDDVDTSLMTVSELLKMCPGKETGATEVQ